MASDPSTGAASSGRPPSPGPGLGPPPPPPPPPSKHSSFYSSSNPTGNHTSSSNTNNNHPTHDPPSRTSPFGGPTPPQTASFNQGLPPFLEQRNPDAFKHNVLPAIGPPARSVPMSPHAARLSSSAAPPPPPMSGPPGPDSAAAAAAAASLHYPHRTGARSSSSSVSSIASGAAHGAPHPGSHRESSPTGGPVHSITSKLASSGAHLAGPPPPPPGPSCTSGTGPTHPYPASSSVLSSFGSPQLRTSSSTAQAYTYRNGSAPSAAHTSYADPSGSFSHSSGRHLDHPQHAHDHYPSSPRSHSAQISSFGNKGDAGKSYYSGAQPPPLPAPRQQHHHASSGRQRSGSRPQSASGSAPNGRAANADESGHDGGSRDGPGPAQQQHPEDESDPHHPSRELGAASNKEAEGSASSSTVAKAAKGGDADEAGKNTNSSDRKVSCLECRASKVKCTGKTPDNSPCARCQRIGRPCVFENHRRGRRPDNLKFQKLEKSLETVTRAFNDFRKLQEPAPGQKGAESAKHGKPSDAEEPVKKKARRGKEAATSERPSPEHVAQDYASAAVAAAAAVNVPQDANVSRRASIGPNHAGPLAEHANLELAARHEDAPHHFTGSREGEPPRRDNWYAGGSGAAPAPPSHVPPPVPGSSSGVVVINGAAASGSSSRNGSLGAIVLSADSRCRALTIGVHVPLPDGDLGLDPIARNVVTLREAHDFFDTFMHMQNQYFPSLDPGLHTFDWLRERSPFLLCVVCLIAARFTEVGNAATGRLQGFLDSVLLPEIWQKGSRSVEVVQGFTLLAAFHDLPMMASDDRTWQYLSFAFGQAIQLGLNRRVKLPDNASIIEQRLARNGERCWLVLFLVEVISASHMGRRSMFTVDRFIGASDSWHLHVAALPADRNIVALVQLRRTQIRLHDLFESTIADPSTGEPALTAYRFDIFIRTCMGELDTWKATWYDSVSWAPHEQGVSREILFAYLAATLNQCVLALRACPDSETATSILRQLSRIAVDGLNVLILFDWPDLVFAVNQNVVVASYCAILALRMTTHEKRWRGAGAIDPLYIYELVDKLIGALSRPGGTLRRSATALSYASYLDAILNHYQSGYEAAISSGSAPFVPLKQRRGSEMNAHEFEAGPAGVTMIPKHPHNGLPALMSPARPSLFSEMTFFDTFFEEV
ncbi:hypothetical protein OC835_001091 [Tilletia horrida]|nr:hypothetical protein OC835_001091 [Tilletia horrida]